MLDVEGRLAGRKGIDRCLQLAPERSTHDQLAEAFGAGYLPADMTPERYRHAKCLKLRLPDDFHIFPDGYFRLIVHNHVLEHIPGSFRSLIDEFHRLLDVGGAMAFTIPEVGIVRKRTQTVEGGEHLASDADRLREHGQVDHVRTFGMDLLECLQAKFATFKLYFQVEDDTLRRIKSMHNAHSMVFWCVK